MKFTVETKELQRITNYLGVVSRINTDDYTGTILIEANEDGTIVFTAINDVSNIVLVSETCNVVETGDVCVSYIKLRSFVMSFAPWDTEKGVKEFNFSLTKTGLVIKVEK